MSGRDDWIDGGTGEWLGADPDDAPPIPSNPRRRWALIVVCDRCNGVDVRCFRTTDLVAYWRCDCGHTWKEEPGIGNSRGAIA